VGVEGKGGRKKDNNEQQATQVSFGGWLLLPGQHLILGTQCVMKPAGTAPAQCSLCAVGHSCSLLGRGAGETCVCLTPRDILQWPRATDRAQHKHAGPKESPE
jgi:hypothetical protein